MTSQTKCPINFAHHTKLTKEEYLQHKFAPPENKFEEILIEYIKMDNISQRSFKNLVKTHVLETYKELSLFGSIVYDPDNANDIDIFGDERELYNLHGSFRKYFNVERQITNSIDEIAFSHYAIHFINIWHGDFFLTTIDLVNTKIINKLPPADFVETSMVKSYNGTYLRKVESKIDVAKAFENIRNKILTPNGTKVFTLGDLYNRGDPFDNRMRNLLVCIRYWQRSFKKRDRGFKFTPNYQGFKYVASYEKSYLSSIIFCVINDPSHIVMEYLSDCVFSSTELCAKCWENLSMTNEYQFVMRTHDNRMWHTKCIIDVIYQLSGDSYKDTLTQEEKEEYHKFFIEYMKTFLIE
jgi:hypothetical protein